MPGPRPTETEKWVRTHCPETVTLVLTAYNRDSYLVKMMDAGVAGYLTKDESSERLIDAIRRAALGEKLFTEEQYDRALNWREQVSKKEESLTNREREILQFIVQGLENENIARILKITPRTVTLHITNIFDKLDVNSRQEAQTWAYKYMSDDLV